MKERFWPILSRNIQYDKCWGTFYKRPQGVWTIIVQTTWTFIWHLRGRQSQTFQKTDVLTMNEFSGPFFLVLSSVTNPSEHFIWVHKLFWQLMLKLKRHFFRIWEVVDNKFFEQKATFPLKKRFWDNFSRDIEHAKFQGTVYKGSQSFLTFFVQMIWDFIWHLRGRLKQTFQKNSCFHDEGSFWPIFPCNIECDKPQGTIYNGPQAILAITLEVDWVERAFF